MTTDVRALLSKLTRAELEVLYSAVDSDIERPNRPRVGPRVEILRGVRDQIDEARRAAAADSTPDYDVVSAHPNWHKLMELVSQVAQEPADHAIEGGLMGMVDFLLERGWTVPRIYQWLQTEDAGPLPWVVTDGKVEAGEQTPILGRFATQELASKFIETLPDYLEGRYGLDGPSE